MTMILHQVIAVLGQALTWLDHSRHLLPLGIVGVLSWSVWIIRVTLSKLYRPVPPGYKTTTSVVVPAYREDPDILMKCLRTWLAEDPTEVIIVPDLEDREVIERLGMVTDPRLRVIPFAHQGKRSALGVGMRAARSEIIVLSDSEIGRASCRERVYRAV
jgi:N-acetylglucosaminyltransferase